MTGSDGIDTLTNKRQINVYAPVEADFTATIPTGPAPWTVTFTNTSTGSYSSSLWDFGDNVTSTLDNPVHTFVAPGTYTVSLAVSGPGGRDAITMTNFITALAEATSTATPTTTPTPNESTPTGTATATSTATETWTVTATATSTASPTPIAVRLYLPMIANFAPNE